MINKKKINLSEKIFIAGGSGMVGSATYKVLIKNGYGSKENNGIIMIPNRKDLNLLESNDVRKWFKLNRPTVVIMAAAKVGGILANTLEPYNFLSENLKLQTNVIEAAFQYKVKRFLFLGSSCIYPKFAHQPIKEESLLSGELESTNEWYAIAKIAGIKLCQALRKQYDFDAISLMPTNLYGPNDNYDSTNSHVMAALIKKFLLAKRDGIPSVTCWGTGTPLREFMHVSDLAKAILFSLEYWCPDDIGAPKDKNGNPLNYLNVGTGKDISIKALAKKIAQACKYEGEIIWDKNKPDGTPRKNLDISNMREIGWQSSIDLDKGINDTISDLLKTKKFL